MKKNVYAGFFYKVLVRNGKWLLSQAVDIDFD